MPLSSNFLSFPLELRFPRCFEEGREACTDFATEQDNRQVIKLDKRQKNRTRTSYTDCVSSVTSSRVRGIE